MRLNPWIAVLLFSVPLAGVAAEDEPRVPVVLRHAGSDLVGLALSVALKDELGAAAFLRLDAEPLANPRITVIVATVDGSVEEPEKQTASSVNVLYDADSLPANGYLITAMVQVCGITRTYECAREIVATVEAALGKLKADHPDLWESLRQSNGG